MKKSYYFSIWACTIWGILVALNYSYFQGDKQNMDDTTVDFIQKLIIAILPALITGLLTFFIGKKSRINNLSNNIDELKNLIGSQEGTTLTKYVSDTFNSIKEDIGRQDRGSLSKQHDNLQNLLEKEIALIEERDDSESDSLNKFDDEQQNIDNTIQQFILFQKSWYRQATKISELNETIEEKNKGIDAMKKDIDAMKKGIDTMKEEINAYKIEIKKYKEEIEFLTEQNTLLSDKLRMCCENYPSKSVNTNIKSNTGMTKDLQSKDDDEIEL